jgi:mannitol 2-dehydrogenase
LARNCTDGSDRIPAFVLPVVREQLRTGVEVSVAVTAVAGWARSLDGVDEHGRSYAVTDLRLSRLAPLVVA